jgi:hypothetical protein
VLVFYKHTLKEKMIISKYKKITPKSLVLEKEFMLQSNKKIICNKDSDNDYIVTTSNLNSLRRLSKVDPVKSILEYNSQLTAHLNLTSIDIFDWRLILGKKQSQEYADYLRNSLGISLKMLTSYHFDIYPKRVSCYKNLSTLTDSSGKILRAPVYKHEGLTGRTGIIEGFNYLTMRKEDRKKLKYPDDNYSLFEIDFKSCEPNFFLRGIDLKIDDVDVYKWLANQINFKINDRSKFKRGILSIIYGADIKIASRLMKLPVREIIKIKDILRIDEFEAYLNEQYEKLGMIYNFYGRPICSNKNIVNYWIQSSAVDYCSLAFKQFIEDYDIKPCFFVHDSLVFAIKNDCSENVTKVKYLNEDISNFNLPVEINSLSA